MGRIKLKPEERKAHRREYQREYQREYRLRNAEKVKKIQKKYDESEKATKRIIKTLPKFSEIASSSELARFENLKYQCQRLKLTGSL